MRIINIIVTHPDNIINEITSFGVLDEQMVSEVVEEAEQCFIDQAVKYKFGEETNTSRDDLRERNDFREDCNEALDDGSIEAGGHTICFLWSSIDNVQL